MRYYEYADTGIPTYGVDIIQLPDLQPQSTTSMTFDINKTGMTAEPTSYVYTLTEVDEFKNVVSGGQVLTGNPTSDPFTVSGLKSGTQYKAQVNAKINSNSGNSIIFYFVMPKDANAISAGAVALDPFRASASKSFLRINNSSKNSKSHKIAWRTFDGIDTSAATSNVSKYYAFGTTLFFQ